MLCTTSLPYVKSDAKNSLQVPWFTHIWRILEFKEVLKNNTGEEMTSDKHKPC